MSLFRLYRMVVAVTLLAILLARTVCAEPPENLRRQNLVAWCIVPFDARQRSPRERAEMLVRLGLKRVAYDWRAQHVAEFEEEIRQYQAHGIEYFAFWGAHEAAFSLFEKYGLHPQVWQTLGSPEASTPEERVRLAAEQVLPLAKRTQQLGCRLGLYNHGGWGGEPDNLVAVCRYLREHHDAQHVGIVYNLHHGHGHIDDFAEVLATMQPYLLCLNLNGMAPRGDERGLKILPIGEGVADLRLLKTTRDSDYKGPIGIIGHTQDDVELRLLDNLAGLEWLLPQLDGQPAGPKPELKTWSPVSTSEVSKNLPGVLVDGQAAYREPPLTVECRVTLADKTPYNILVASDTKRSGAHWELFSMVGSGMLTAYLPGMVPDHVRSDALLCDGRPHTVTMLYEPSRIRLLLDGQVV
ncbi:MAG: TIM barrel protein, partial [Planctomycetaceae bacterium]|nr:TIM barrel protein [Planctomycetaceae bacterium]